ncbi:PREDICTED: uncharacterized protein LOC108566276 [Nicrophorus vespilloides]|uniref:Uncharacterized protein LOC108566276 n=1 Tax=Nicrophorus vespilloides TaxID=110193 RepID=A0ABM1N423_NICVS|nr:PREDICTED: uncharacterized protein LOC108566276 [Nicrophorus vespilloides]
MGNNTLIQIMVLFLLSTVESDVVKEDLEPAEANGKLEIIKQIKKVNDDGSYTIGYEADDGSFKIESRDVLGNIKGTYGYIDDNGEIKRVSYSTSNSSEILPPTSEPASVVQRIPAKMNRTKYTNTTPGPPITTTNVIQVVPRRKVESTTTRATTTDLYENSTPARILAQAKPMLRSTPNPKEGQLSRPEVTIKPTEIPLYRRIPPKPTLLDEDKPVTEETELRGNLLRRQLPQDKMFDPRQHALNAQQASGHDSLDIYSPSVTTGSPHPLFTTIRPRIVPTTPAPVIHRPTIRYPQIYHKPTTDYPQESASEVAVTPSPPIVQIPANEDEPQRVAPYVELRHPFHRGAILVPVQHRRIEEPYYVRRMPTKFKPIPVHVDENGFIREVHQRPFVTQSDIINEVDQIKPPVSTRDFQKLLEQLILRQTNLEKISTLTQTRPQQMYYENTGPVQFVPRPQYYTPSPPQNYHPTKRMTAQEEEYLPAPVREMLLLRMLQLAINPALPLESSDNIESATTPIPRKDAIRNVEILGEEEEHKRPSRTKRYKEIELDYFD